MPTPEALPALLSMAAGLHRMQFRRSGTTMQEPPYVILQISTLLPAPSGSVYKQYWRERVKQEKRREQEARQQGDRGFGLCRPR